MSKNKSTYSHPKKPVCYDIDISYCGTIHCKLPYNAKDCDHVMLEDTSVFRRNRSTWERVETPSQFYFYDMKNEKVLFVDTKACKITKATIRGKVLECNSRTLYKVLGDCWKMSCSLKDTRSIVKLSTVTTEESIIITPLSYELDLHSKSDFSKKDITLGYKAIELDVSSLEKGETKTLIYKIEEECKGTILLVNHIIARLPEGGSGSTVQPSCGPFLGTEEIQKGDLVRSEYDSEKIRVTKLKTGGTITNTELSTSTNSNAAALSVVNDSHGNTYFAGFIFDDSITIGNFTITAFGTFKSFVAKRGPDKKWVWVAEGENYSIASMTTDGTNIYTFGNKNAGTLMKLGTKTYQYIDDLNATGAVVAKLQSDGNWDWAQMYYTDTGPVSGNDISTDAQGYLYVTGSTFAQDAGSEVKLTNSGVVSPTPPAGNIEILYVSKLSYSGAASFTTIMHGFTLGARFARPYTIATNSSGVSYIGGTLTGRGVGIDVIGDSTTSAVTGLNPQDAFLASIDNDGVWRWINVMTSTVLNNGLDGAIRSADVDDKGTVYVSGYYRMTDIILGNGFKLSGSPGINKFIASYTQDGGFGWAVQTTYQGVGYSSITSDSKGNVYMLIGESVNGTVKLGSELTYTGNNPIVAKASNGQWIWVKDVVGFAERSKSITTDEQGQITIYTRTDEGTHTFDFSDDYIERLKGIAQSNGNTTTQLPVVWTSNIVDTHQSGLLPGYDYGINDLGELVLLSPTNFKKYPLLQYTGTACSTTHLILKKETETLKNDNNSEDQLERI